MKIMFLLLIIFMFISCDENKQTELKCSGVIVKTKARADDDIYIRGSFNGWQLSTPMIYKDGEWSIELFLPPDDYGYQFYSKTNDKWFMDDKNPLTIYINNAVSSRLIVENCKYPSLELVNRPIINNKSYSFQIKFNKGVLNSDIDLSKSNITLNGEKINVNYDETSNIISVSNTVIENGKYSYLFKIKDKNNFAAKTLFVPIWIEDIAFKWEDSFIYQIMTDRFLNGDLNNDNPIADVDVKANWQGGDFKGIIQKIDDNYFTDLGINAIWISSPLRNTQNKGKGMGGDPRYYAAYHSYWPITTGWNDFIQFKQFDSPIEPHFGTSDELKELVEKAHKKGIRVLFDFVPNHVHTESDLWKNYQNLDWFNPLYVCGWEKPIECWFTEYLADFNHKNIDAMNTLINHLIWLIQEYNIDGLRLDAIRLMVLDFTSTLKTFIQREIITTGIPFYMVGETFTADNGWDEIGYYLGEDKLDGQFDFPLFHHTARTFYLNNETFTSFNDFLIENDSRYQEDYYEKALMSNFLGNHDLCRALSLANGDFDGSSQGGALAHQKVWENSPIIPENEEPFKRLRLAQTFLFSVKGIPTIYQGDEFGMPGANDPDNRRMMTFNNTLTTFQQKTLEHVQKLGNFRKEHKALRYGERINLFIESDFWVFAMKYQDDIVIFAFNKSSVAVTKEINLTQLNLSKNSLINLFDGSIINLNNNKITITVNSFESVVLY